MGPDLGEDVSVRRVISKMSNMSFKERHLFVVVVVTRWENDSAVKLQEKVFSHDKVFLVTLWSALEKNK